MTSPSKPRTLKQNNSLHAWCSDLAEALNDSGLSMMKVLKHEAEIPWTKITVKELLFKQIMQAMFHKDSTTQLTTKEMIRVADTLTRHLSVKFDVITPWPSLEEQYNQSLEDK